MNQSEAIAVLLQPSPVLLDALEAIRKEIAALRGLLEVRQPKAKKWLTLKEAAEVLNVSEKTARRYITRGLLRRNAATRNIRIPAEDVEKIEGKVVF
jgi:excisionase family DNA binding protein